MKKFGSNKKNNESNANGARLDANNARLNNGEKSAAAVGNVAVPNANNARFDIDEKSAAQNTQSANGAPNTANAAAPFTQKLSRLLLNSDGAVSVLVVLLGFLFGTILILCVGRNPSGMYKAILQVLTGFNIDRGIVNLRYVGEWLNVSIPFVLCGLSMAFAARAGLFNIGGEGQYIVGLTAAQVVALFGPQIPGVHWMLALAAAIVVGSIWGGIVGFLKAKFEVSEVVATIMLNYVALYLSRIVTMSIPGTNTYRTVAYPETVSIESKWISALFNGSMLDIGFFFMLAAVVIYWFLMEKTNIGFGLRATGFNKDAARCSGINVVKSIIVSMAVSGSFAGLAGGLVAIGSFTYGRVISGMDNYGFTGIAVALVGNNTALGTLLAGLLFGMLSSAQPLMQSHRIPKEITFIIQGLIVIFIAIKEGIRIFIRWREKTNRTNAATETAAATKTADSIQSAQTAAADSASRTQTENSQTKNGGAQ